MLHCALNKNHFKMRIIVEEEIVSNNIDLEGTVIFQDSNFVAIEIRLVRSF